MVLKTKTYNFTEEIERLETEIEELQAIVDDFPDHDAVDGVREERNSLQSHLEGVKWARDEAYEAEYVPVWDEDVDEITLAGLTGGEVAKVEDTLSADAGDGSLRIEFIAAGTPAAGDETPAHATVSAEAPFVEAGQSDEDRLAIVSDLPFPFQKWAHARIDSLTCLSGNGQPNYDELREELLATSTQK